VGAELSHRSRPAQPWRHAAAGPPRRCAGAGRRRLPMPSARLPSFIDHKFFSAFSAAVARLR
jgi:hypothetical protein